MISGTVLERGDFFARAQATIRQRTGLVFNEARRADLARGLGKAIERAGTRDVEAYLARLETDPRVLDHLVAEITVGETYFFREPEQFAVIREHILPDLASRRPHGRPLRVWSAGCATGEEPYSVTIMLREAGWLDVVHILGTDIARTALARGKRGRYTRWSFRGVPAGVREAYFVERGAELALSATIRAAVDFGYLNLAEDTYPSLATGVWGMDLILCRNVLIYFDSDAVAAVARRLLASLADGGWLLLGASDPMLINLVPCEVVVTRAGLS